MPGVHAIVAVTRKPGLFHAWTLLVLSCRLARTSPISLLPASPARARRHIAGTLVRG